MMDAEAPKPGISTKKGVHIKKATAFILGVFFVCALVATALTTYYVTESDSSVSESVKTLVTSEGKAGEDFRLPTALRPTNYVIQIQPFIGANYNFSTNGHVDITFDVVEVTNQVIFHINDIITVNETIKLVPADDPTGNGLEFASHEFDQERQFYIGTLSADLEVGLSYIISMDYIGYLNDNMAGFYRSSYMENGEEIFLATTQFQATDARRAFPCFDEPALKATFDISMAREDGMGVISNMPNISSTPLPNQPGWYLETFNTTLPMSTYLIAFIVSDFVSISSNANDHVLFRVWARREAIYQADYALSIGPDVLTFFEDYYSIPFPLPKQDMAALPDFSAGAMENWGLITYRETALLYDPVLSGASNKQRVGVVVAHELAHQWFGDLVTPSWWTDLWLNEGFASYLEYIGLNAVEPTFKMLEQFITDDLHYVFSIDCLESSHPISIEVQHPDEIDEIFDAISYNKGAAIIRMMNFYLTESTFKQGLTNYLNAMSYSAATQDDLWSYLTDQAHADGTLDQSLTVKTIMDTWTLQMGYPVVTVTRSDDGTALIQQERFLLVKNANSSDTHNYMWWIPLTYTTQDNPDFTQTTVMDWMSDTETEKTLSGFPTMDRWVIFNIIQNGYYRVNYDVDNWNNLIAQLSSDFTVINTLNRAQLIDDALDLARAGILNYEIALEVNSYLGGETELVPWYAALDNLEYLEEMFTRTSGYGALKDYLLTLSIPLYDSVGFEDSLSDPHTEQLKRAAALSWTCNLQYGPCLQNSTTLYQQWMANPSDTSIVSPNLKSTVYCYGIAEGTEVEWDFAWDQYLSSNLGTEKDTLLYAMGCSKIPWVLERYLDMAFTDGGGVKKQDAYKVFNGVSGNDYGRDIAWNYLQTQWDSLSAYYGGPLQPAEFAYTASSEFNTEIELQELQQLRDDHSAELGNATQSLDQAIERVQNNIDWMNNYYSVIEQWLIDQGYGDGIGRRLNKLRLKNIQSLNQ